MLQIVKLTKLCLILLVFFVVPLRAQENTDPFAKFGNYTEDSDWVIDHRVWNNFLAATVVVIRSSGRTLGSTNNVPSTGTKIRRGSRSSSRLEGNRVTFHLLEQDHIQLITKYRKELERLPDYYPLAEFSRDEQLAYWLNLHNAVLYETLAERYPISNLKKLRKSKKDKPSLWDQKLVTVEGVPLSLNDIQNNILIRHWQNPMVLYGLYQGSIGGPSIPDRAFTSVNVHTLLERSAKEFINSNRGSRVSGNEMRVSLIYDWGRAAFPDWESDLGRHIAEVASTTTRREMGGVARFDANLYDWKIADTKGGTLSNGPKHSTAANLLTVGKVNALPTDIKGGAFVIRGESEASFVSQKGGLTFMLTDMYRNGLIVPGAYDEQTIKVLKEMTRILDERPAREGTVTTFECGSEDTTCLKPEPEQQDKKD